MSASATMCVVALAVTACGGSAATATTAASRPNRAFAFSQCMRAHGVTNFPDPSASGGIELNRSSGIDPSSPTFQRAQSACGKLGLGPETGHPSANARASMLAFAQCLRRHGLSDVSDPTTTPPTKGPGPGRGGAVIGRGGVFLYLGTTVIDSPGFNRAAAACGMKVP